MHQILKPVVQLQFLDIFYFLVVQVQVHSFIICYVQLSLNLCFESFVRLTYVLVTAWHPISYFIRGLACAFYLLINLIQKLNFNSKLVHIYSKLLLISNSKQIYFSIQDTVIKLFTKSCLDVSSI